MFSLVIGFVVLLECHCDVCSALFAGISVSQQRLIWQSVELQDDMTVESLNLQDGTKLTLIPAMRGGPLNYRRGVIFIVKGCYTNEY